MLQSSKLFWSHFQEDKSVVIEFLIEKTEGNLSELFLLRWLKMLNSNAMISFKLHAFIFNHKNLMTSVMTTPISFLAEFRSRLSGFSDFFFVFFYYFSSDFNFILLWWHKYSEVYKKTEVGFWSFIRLFTIEKR